METVRPALPPLPVDLRAKGFPVLDPALDPSEVATQGWGLFDGRFLLPVMALRASALEHDVELLAQYTRSRGVSLAPHGKTTMAPAIFERQLAAGAWAITVATAWQARVAAAAGVPRILLANEVVDPGGIDWLAGTLEHGPETYCWVDSLAGVEIMDLRIGERSGPRLPVLVEVGLPDGRAGVRDVDQGLAVARAVAASGALRLAGVAFFEGIVPREDPASRPAGVSELIALARSLATRVADLVVAGGGREIILTGGGSLYPDVVVDAIAEPLPVPIPTRAVLRSGAYVTHDHGGYDITGPFGSRGAPGGPRLRPGLEVWAPVLSVPETGLAIAGAGKRDLSFDLGMPPVIGVRRADGTRLEVDDDDIRVTRLFDQHACLAVPSAMGLAVGDLVAFGVRHACTGFDRWRWLPVIDDEDRVVDAFELVF
jgi:D-serine deaminase-like pyridoxal phosphate-dependent protein